MKPPDVVLQMLYSIWLAMFCRDWCISRQIWWGHRIPAYRVTTHDPQLQVTYQSNNLWYCEIIFIHWTFHFMFFMGRAIHEFKGTPLRSGCLNLYFLVTISLSKLILWYLNMSSIDLANWNVSVEQGKALQMLFRDQQIKKQVLNELPTDKRHIN